MSRIPRTPVHWPRMKVRGRRNRAKLSARIERRVVIPYAVPAVCANGVYTFEAVPTWRLGAHRIEHHSVRDGYGRVVSVTRARATPVEPPSRPRDTFSFSFKADEGAFDRLAAILFGRESPPDAVVQG